MKDKLTKFLDENSYSYNTWENDDETIITIKVSNKPTDNKVDTVYTNVKELRVATHMTQQMFADYFNIPFRTLQDWEYSPEHCRDYTVALLEYKLRKDGVIK